MGVLKRQGIKNTISGYIGILIGFVNLIIIQPYFLTKEELGLTRLLYSFSFFIATLIPLGITNTTIRFFPLFKNDKEQNHGYFGFMNLFPVAGFFAAGTMIWLLRDFIMDQFRSKSPLFNEYFDYVFPLMFFCSFITVFAVYCNANFKSTIPSYLNDIVVRLLTIAVISLYFIRVVDLNGFIFLFVSIYAVQFVLLLAYIFYFDKPSLKIKWKVFREKNFPTMIRFGFILWLAGLSSIGLKYFDTIMVGKYMPLEFVAIYSIAAFIPTVIEAPANALERIGAAKIAFAWNDNDMKQLLDIYRKSSLYMFLVGSFVFLNINANIYTVLRFLPAGYEQGESVVRILAAGTLFNMATGLNIPILQNSKKYGLSAWLLVSLALLVLVLQMLFIQRFGLNGAAIATVTAYLLYNFITCFLVYRFFKLQPFTRKSMQVLSVAILLFAIELFLPHFENKFVDIAIRTSLISCGFLVMVYKMKIVPEFHRYLPWSKEN